MLPAMFVNLLGLHTHSKLSNSTYFFCVLTHPSASPDYNRICAILQSSSNCTRLSPILPTVLRLNSLDEHNAGSSMPMDHFNNIFTPLSQLGQLTPVRLHFILFAMNIDGLDNSLWHLAWPSLVYPTLLQPGHDLRAPHIPALGLLCIGPSRPTTVSLVPSAVQLAPLGLVRKVAPYRYRAIRN